MISLTIKKPSLFLVLPKGKMTSEKISRAVCMREDLDISSKLVDKGITKSVRKQ